jgi:hypothetical protein
MLRPLPRVSAGEARALSEAASRAGGTTHVQAAAAAAAACCLLPAHSSGWLAGRVAGWSVGWLVGWLGREESKQASKQAANMHGSSSSSVSGAGGQRRPCTLSFFLLLGTACSWSACAFQPAPRAPVFRRGLPSLRMAQSIPITGAPAKAEEATGERKRFYVQIGDRMLDLTGWRNAHPAGACFLHISFPSRLLLCLFALTRSSPSLFLPARFVARLRLSMD